jgi:hypothetical protein
VNRPKAIGTAAETAVVRYLQANGFPHAERRALRGTADAGDIAGTIGICWSVKGGAAAETASDAVIDTWLDELERQRVHAHANVGVLVCKRRAVGPGNAGAWPAYLDAHALTTLIDPHGDAPHAEAPAPTVRLRLADVVALLRWAGYGAPLPAAVTEVTG